MMAAAQHLQRHREVERGEPERHPVGGVGGDALAGLAELPGASYSSASLQAMRSSTKARTKRSPSGLLMSSW